jgi:single-stranded-DNA-specific exonuclease
MIDEVQLERARALLAEVAAVVPHTDADGLAAGAIALRERGQPAAAAVLLGRGETPWRDPLAAGTPALLDWGMRPLEGPALIIDHHAPEAEPGRGRSC